MFPIQNSAPCPFERNLWSVARGTDVSEENEKRFLVLNFNQFKQFLDIFLFQEHVSSQHSDVSQEVVCPICASFPGGDPNHVTDDFQNHLNLEHRSGARDLVSFLDEPGGLQRQSAVM